jgi:hypothetical protein
MPCPLREEHPLPVTRPDHCLHMLAALFHPGYGSALGLLDLTLRPLGGSQRIGAQKDIHSSVCFNNGVALGFLNPTAKGRGSRPPHKPSLKVSERSPFRKRVRRRSQEVACGNLLGTVSMHRYYSASRRCSASARFGAWLRNLAISPHSGRNDASEHPKSLVATTVAGRIAFCIIVVLGGLVLTRSINQSADQWRAPQGDQRILGPSRRLVSSLAGYMRARISTELPNDLRPVCQTIWTVLPFHAVPQPFPLPAA